jgi:hypothetical protein
MIFTIKKSKVFLLLVFLSFFDNLVDAKINCLINSIVPCDDIIPGFIDCKAILPHHNRMSLATGKRTSRMATIPIHNFQSWFY